MRIFHSTTNGSDKPMPEAVNGVSDTPSPTDFSQALIDHFSLLPSATSTFKDSIDVSVSCELMNNSEAGMPGKSYLFLSVEVTNIFLDLQLLQAMI